MSRVGKMPVTVPQGVDVSITAEQISVKGSNGTLVRAVERAGRGEEGRRHADASSRPTTASPPVR